MAGNKDFVLNISRFVKKQKAAHDEIVRKVAIDLFTRVILRSPVDTGRFRANWIVSIGVPASGTISTNDKAGTVTVAKATAEIMKLKAGDMIWLTNNLPYALVLEYGHSQQAPTGMVRITIREFKEAVRKAAAKAKASA